MRIFRWHRSTWLRSSLHGCTLVAGVACIAGLAGLLETTTFAQSSSQTPTTRHQSWSTSSVTNTVCEFGWIGEDELWYAVERPSGNREFLIVDTLTGRKQPIFDPVQAATQLAPLLNIPAQDMSLTCDRLDVTKAHVDVLLKETSTIVRQNRATSTWQVLSLDAASREQHPFLLSSSSTRSTSSTRESSAIIVVNQSSGPVELQWLAHGNTQSYGSIAPGATKRQHTFTGHRWSVVREDGTKAFEGAAADDPAIVIVHDAANAEPPIAPSPDPAPATSDVRVEFDQGNVVLVRSGARSALTTRTPTDKSTYMGPVQWSPDRSRFVVWQRTPGEQRQVHIVESSPADQVQPKLHTFTYDKPGDRIDVAIPRLFDAVSGTSIALADQLSPNPLFPNPRFIDNLAWQEDSSSFSFVYVERGHRVMRLVRVTRDGAVSTVTDETPNTFVDVSNSLFVHRLANTGQTLWLSERDGWRHLYLLHERDLSKPALQLTKGEWVVRSVDHVDEARGEVTMTVSGVYAGQDPYYIHVARVNLDGTGFTLLTDRDATHRVGWSPLRTKLIARSSRVDDAEVVELRDARTGSALALLEQADLSALRAQGWTPPQRFVAKARDGTTDIYGIIVRPSSFDASKQYSVIENIYAGPHGAFVPKAFTPSLGTMHALAEQGFIVVQIDGMGTAHRSKAFHDVCFKNLADAGLPDRIAWLRAAAAQHKELDLSRVGIYGGSAGGQNALSALLHHGDFYKVAVADCGCHDNRVDKQWWNEAWMGYPIDDSYAASSNVTHAHKLQGKLLLIVGELDRNVDPASTMQVVNALVKADKDFDFLVLPGVGHGAAETAYGKRRRTDFFVRHLSGERD